MPYVTPPIQYIKKNGDVVWRVQFGTVNGERGTFTIGSGISKRQAVIERNRILKIVTVDGGDPRRVKNQEEKNGELRLEDIFNKFLKTHQHYSKKTLGLYSLAVKNLSQTYKNPLLKDISDEDMNSWLDLLSNNRSKVTVSIYRRAIVSMYNWALEMKYIEKKLKVKRIVVPEADPANYFEESEIKQILNALSDKGQLFKLVFLALETGGRISELINLEWARIDLKHGSLSFIGRLAKTKKTRTVPLRKEAVEEISTWEKIGKYVISKSDRDAVYWSDHGTPSGKFRQILLNLNLYKTEKGKRSFHTLRDTYATHLLMKNVPMYIVSQLLGHESIITTEKHYAHLIPKSVKKAITKLPNWY